MRVDGDCTRRLLCRGPLVVMAILCCSSLPVMAWQDSATAPPHAVETILSRRASITLRSLTLPDALFAISETWNVNLLFGKDVTGDVNGVYRDVTLREVLDSLLLANGYGYRTKGQSVIIMKLMDLGDANAMLKTESIRLPRHQSAEFIEVAKMFASPEGRMEMIASLDTLMVRDYPENIEQIRSFITDVRQDHDRRNPPPPKSIQVPPDDSGPPIMTDSGRTETIAYFSPRHTDAESLRESFETFLGPFAQVVVIAEENRLAIVDQPEGITLARRIFKELDRPREQVRITALIYDVSVAELENLGVNWTHNAKAGLDAAGNPRHVFGGKFGPLSDPADGAFTIGGAVGAVTDAAVDASSSSTGAARISTLNKYIDIDAIISALEQTDGARLLADPSVTVIDREEASIRIVTEVPIQQLTQTAQGGSIGTTTFRDAGVTLTVKPRIGGDGTITMHVVPTFSVLSGFNEGQPIIDSREANTTVRVMDGQTIVIGGLRQRSEIETISGIPKLMHWKRLGRLFRSHNTSVRESELIVFLRPEVVTTSGIDSGRDAAGLCVVDSALARVGWPTDAPILPSCNDTSCPNHYPRYRLANPFDISGVPVSEPLMLQPLRTSLPNLQNAFEPIETPYEQDVPPNPAVEPDPEVSRPSTATLDAVPAGGPNIETAQHVVSRRTTTSGSAGTLASRPSVGQLTTRQAVHSVTDNKPRQPSAAPRVRQASLEKQTSEVQHARSEKPATKGSMLWSDWLLQRLATVRP